MSLSISHERATPGAPVLTDAARPERAAAPAFHVIRRNGAVTVFDGSKIAVAVTKAFLAVEGSSAAASRRVHEAVEALTADVVATLTRRADVETVNAALPAPMVAEPRAVASLEEFLSGVVPGVTSPRRSDAHNIATALLRQHVERHLLARGLKELPQRSSSAYYFPDCLIANNKVPYTAASGRRTNKNVVGRSERNKVYWHLAMKVSVVLGPPAIVRFKPYVVFSDDGQAAITDPKRTSPIRRRFCKNWWNQHWRQLQEAFAVWLAAGAAECSIQLDGSQRLVVAGKLLQLTAERHIVGDLQFQDEAEEPAEPDDDDDVGFDPDLAGESEE